MKSWYEIYKEEISQSNGLEHYYKNKISTKGKMINMITSHLEKNDLVLEAGCGTGILTTHLASLGYNAMGIDIDENILEMAKKIADRYSPVNQPVFKKESIFDLNYPENYFKVTFSSGVLEHFSDNEIIETLSYQIYCSRYVIVSIPTNYFNKDEALHGDERFMAVEEWRNLIEMSSGRILKEDKCHFRSMPIFDFRLITREWPYKFFLIE